ncbi:soluble lytic murein transglycosylase [Legionella birminghamensis]|uniref:Soluble lytic murein transglycosylase n=1 Tax=Legionella birminghamensis TaxID=28083 RepID=A0A378I9D5_9GAMM|nr:transglycosylase SLT domain-containing protein [Legionella birminghamensis]KTC68059.1 soluble lytic murein transglycosylase [Legionella birminghamensis]STX31231.1 soluble lytic murein transglycosylase [Legionella birminghamensis]
MKKILFLITLLCLSITGNAASAGETYVLRFMNYMEWSQNLPQQATPEFLAFIGDDTPLANRLREKWLYQLARQRDWANYTAFYRPSSDVSLQCFARLAEYFQGKTELALEGAKPLWLKGDSQPGACNQLFDFLIKSGQFDEQLITDRIRLALDKRNLGLARYLLKLYQKPRLEDETILVGISQNPARIAQLQPKELHDAFYLYGLKRLVSTNMDLAIKLWQQPKTRKILSEAQQQSFLVQLVIYKAMRNHEDTEQWFSRIKPVYYNDALLDWEIRAALKQQNWPKVEKLILFSTNKDSPCWQYWLGRAKEAQGKKAESQAIFGILAETRNYYGFLASLRLHKKPSFVNETVVKDPNVLKPYRAFTSTIKNLYANKQTLQASRMLNDFVLELPKEDKSALIYWVANELQWHGKSVYLSNTEELSNQLSLRFPLAHEPTVTAYSKNYQISKEFIYAIIRQESSFREDVVSMAGARGLMQIMPDTAKMVAKQEKIAYGDKNQLFSSQKNINIGVAYLKQLAKRYHAHPVLMAAAYNAGPRQVNYWLKNHPPKQIDIWIETLPWHETRNYLKNVIAFYAVYQFRMQQKPDLSIFMQPIN